METKENKLTMSVLEIIKELQSHDPDKGVVVCIDGFGYRIKQLRRYGDDKVCFDLVTEEPA